MSVRIVGVGVAAIRDHDGTIYSVPRPGRHHDVIRLMVEKGRPTPITGTQGFLLTDGRFAMRKEAGRLAIASGEISALKWPPDLYSEDLW